MKTHLIKVKEELYRIEIADLKGEVFCNFRYEQAYQLSHVVWKGFMRPEAIIEAYKYMGYFCGKHGYLVSRSITDCRLTDGSFYESNAWLLEDYTPRLIKRGFKYAAILPPQELAARISMDFYLEDARNMYIIKLAETYQEAYQWVIQQPFSLNPKPENVT
ncbi:MAG: hypothetical protein NW226_15235 [Microscillaceae bacterium]|nr:hypothetical protein [Microscillaceae bacterium]